MTESLTESLTESPNNFPAFWQDAVVKCPNPEHAPYVPCGVAFDEHPCCNRKKAGVPAGRSVDVKKLGIDTSGDFGAAFNEKGKRLQRKHKAKPS